MITNKHDFHSLANIFPLLEADAFDQLVADIKAHGLREPIWLYEGKILDGRNRYRACVKARIEPSFRDYGGNDPLAFVISLNLKRRHLNASQLAFVALEIERVEAVLAQERMLAGKKLDPKQKIAGGQARDKAAKAVDVNRQYVSDARKISKIDSGVADMVRAGTINLNEGKKLVALSDDVRPIAIKALASGENIRVAIRAAKKQDYNKRIQATKPKPLQGKYRIIYADPPWKLNDDWMDRLKIGSGSGTHFQMSNVAKGHYDLLDDQQICDYRPGDGSRSVKELADKNAVLFMWVTAPMLEHCFPIIEAWGFTYKTLFVWDKVKHNVGFYNSVRAELLLICTRGTCTPDAERSINSVQSIERSNKHSEKPEEFYDIIESMYDHGRKLELFSRGKTRPGWDADGNEIDVQSSRCAA